MTAPEAAGAFARSVESWHEFYVLAGTAAVTLVGLLFVALSFHLDALIDARRAHLLALARAAFSSFLYVMLLALMFLVPGQSRRVLATSTAIAALGFLIVAIVMGRRAPATADPDGHGRSLMRRRRTMIALFALGLVVPAGLARAHDTDWLMGFVVIVVGQLANAAWTSWDLLVEVGRMRRANPERERG